MKVKYFFSSATADVCACRYRLRVKLLTLFCQGICFHLGSGQPCGFLEEMSSERIINTARQHVARTEISYSQMKRH